MGEILKLRIQLRRDTTENWEKYNPVLLPGEAAVSLDTNKMKIGDGVSRWAELNYLAGDSIPGLTTAEIGSYPIKQSDGTVKWTKPTELTAEGVQQELAAIKEQISSIPVSITAGGETLENNNGVVEIPLATAAKSGLVKGSEEITISNDGTLNIQSVDVSKLSQEESLILCGGDAETV